MTLAAGPRGRPDVARFTGGRESNRGVRAVAAADDHDRSRRQRPEGHLHDGGQGSWVARLAATLAADVTLCCALGGEPGRVVHGLLEAEPITLRAAAGGTANGVYIHARRGGDRVEIVSVDSQPLDRHETDELYGIALGAGLDADVTMVTGCEPADIVNAETRTYTEGSSAICAPTGSW
jgi:hypothetical protein